MMPYKITHDGEDVKLEVTTSMHGMSIDSPEILEIARLARALHAVIPMRKIKFDRKGITNEFNYELEATDGRKWTQVIRVDEIDAPMSFDVPDFWRVSEFSAHRPLRQLVIGLALLHDVDKITFDWK